MKNFAMLIIIWKFQIIHAFCRILWCKISSNSEKRVLKYWSILIVNCSSVPSYWVWKWSMWDIRFIQKCLNCKRCYKNTKLHCLWWINEIRDSNSSLWYKRCIVKLKSYKCTRYWWKFSWIFRWYWLVKFDKNNGYYISWMIIHTLALIFKLDVN